MSQIGAIIDHTSLDQTWAPACNLSNDSQHLIYGQPSTVIEIDCEFLAPMLTPIIAGQIKVIECTDNLPITAVYDKPRFYSTLPQKHQKCATGRSCGKAASTMEGPEYFQPTVEEISMPIPQDNCGAGGCGSHPGTMEALGVDRLLQAQFDTFSQMIDIRFLKYIYSPVKNNLAVASVTAAPTLTITTPSGGPDDYVDYASLRTNWETALVTELAPADDALALGYDEAILPVQISAVDLEGECVCCLDGEGLRRTISHVQDLVSIAFQTAPSKGGLLIVANPVDVPYVTLNEIRQAAYVGTTMADPFNQKALIPDEVRSEHEVYDMGLGNMLVLSRMAPAGKVLFLPEQVRENINFAQSPFEMKKNPASNCDWEDWHLAKKAFSWFIPACYRDKYYIVELPEECCKGETCTAP